MQPKRVGCGKARDAEILWKAGPLCDVCLSFFVSTGVCGREEGTCVGENGLLLRSMEGWEEGFVAPIYTAVFIVN